MANSIEQLSFELTIGVLTQQERAVMSLRASAGTILGAASIAGDWLSVSYVLLAIEVVLWTISLTATLRP